MPQDGRLKAVPLQSLRGSQDPSVVRQAHHERVLAAVLRQAEDERNLYETELYEYEKALAGRFV